MNIIRPNIALYILAFVALSLSLTGCSSSREEFQRGYIIDESALAQVKKGVSGQQVLEILGSPTTVSTVGNKSWYYISQKTERGLHFMGEKITDQRVVAVYFNQALRVERVALYGIQDGVVFDFISRKTAAGGSDQNFVTQLFQGLLRF